MKLAVIGAGIVGVTSAWELAVDGHEVTVFERRGSVAAESSFANAGLVAPAYTMPWSAPGNPLAMLSQWLGGQVPVRLHPSLHAREIAWMWHWWRSGRLRTLQANRLRMQRLAVFSRARLHELTRALKLDHERAEGLLVLLRGAKDRERIEPGLASLAESGSRVALVDANQCRLIEPGLSDETPLHGGVYLANDDVGNCRQFAALLRTEAQRAGVRFRFHTKVQRVVPGDSPQLVHIYAPPDDATVLMNPVPEPGPIDAQDTVPTPMQAITERFDAVVVCAALASVPLLRPHGLSLPLEAVYGYSVTAPLRRVDAHGEVGPRAGVVDERHRIAITRLGTRVRVAGGFEFGGKASVHDPRLVQSLYKVLHDWFPGSARLSQAQVWKGARPTLPDGPPMLGASGIAGIWLNLGHGASGWSLACGSARLLADAITGRPPAVDIDGLNVARLRH